MRIFLHVLKLSIALLVFSSFIFAQAPDFKWSTKGSGTLNDQGLAIAVDPFDNVYITGQFFSTSIVFPPALTISMPGGSGNCDFFLSKFDKDGNAIWGVKGGGTLTDRGYGIAFDHQGQLLVTGHYFGNATFGSTILSSSGNLDAFTAKYDTAGNIIWMKEGKSASQVSTRSITSDAQGNSVITGYYGTSTVDSVRFDQVKIVTNGQRDIFIVKYNNDGDVLWGKTAGGLKSGDEGKDVVVDAAGNVYVTGMFTDTASFGSITLNGNGNSEIFVAKYNSAGELAWAKSAGGLKVDVGYGIALDQLGNVFICGNIDSAASFESLDIIGSGDYDAFIAKYDTSGNLIWVRSAGGIAKDAFNDISVDAEGNCLMTGYFNGPATFGSAVLNGVAGDDISFLKYDQNGNVLWAKEAAGADNDRAQASTIDAAGNIIATGYFKSWIKFNPDSLTSSGVEDIFITKLGDKVVPVELTSFNAVFEYGKVELKWSTASELNNYGFEIQRCFDKINYEKIGFTKGFGTSTDKHNYSFTDPAVKSGTIYYRLKQLDLDGSFSHSEIVEVTAHIPEVFELKQNFPNPFNPSTSIKFSLPADAIVSLSIYNNLGEEMEVLFNKTLNAGQHSVDFNAQNYSSGMYVYVLKAVGSKGESYISSRKMLLIK